MEYYSLICYGLNTYTEEEWAYGNVDPKLFDPNDLNTDQWAKTAYEAGMKGLILVCKHHDGFCLWPSKYTDYSVKATPWKDGQGDVLGELKKSCKKYGLHLGVYLSPWDRNHAKYGYSEYVEYYYNQLEELMTNYGEVFEFWIDGANGGTGYYGGANERRNIDRRTYYGYDSIFSIVHKYQPDAVIFSDAGPGVRWVGNEAGIGNETNWNTFDPEGKFPGESESFGKRLGTGDKGGPQWIPAEVNTTLLWPKAWYFHTGHQPRSLSNLMDLYYTSIARGSTLNLGIAIAPSGRIQHSDVRALLKFKKQVDLEFSENLIVEATLSASNTRGNSKNFSIQKSVDNNTKTYWASEDSVKEATIEINFAVATRFNRLLLQEYIRLGQRVKAFTFEVEQNGKFEKIAQGTTVGYKRILQMDEITTTKARLTLKTDAPCITISELGLFNAPVLIDDPVLHVSLNNTVTFEEIEGATVFYSLKPKPEVEDFIAYSSPLILPGGGEIHYFAKADSGDYSTDIIDEEIGISRELWKTVPANLMKNAIDNKARTFADSKSGEIIIDFGRNETFEGFSYLPRQDGKKEGIIYEYELYCSRDSKNWGSPLATGIFSNIENNPGLQKLKLKNKVTGRFIKLISKSDVKNSDLATFAEIKVY
ncbi:alpha-L-fucosidase [Maribellus maritimus]|uniref:alpha-L-fucosidase n=1 Tax=Maribellus maritimus TaxID=2870838 RepID=UPI001EEB94EF|nr:alpha-L-fucosidase [Maribellus maritimus]MCG6188307.1 alpha-L-fucosidase [Maribellus maritimus]